MPIRPTRSHAAAALVGAMLVLGSPLARAADLDLEISGVTATSADKPSQVQVAAYASAEGWLKKSVATARVATTEARDGVIKLRLKGLPEGPVAIAIYQDLNGNGKLDSSVIGIPIEPYAFSRQAQGNFGPPTFDQAALPAGTTRHAIRLPSQP
jgi:uncharacterized protein (DUF2141 family)